MISSSHYYWSLSDKHRASTGRCVAQTSPLAAGVVEDVVHSFADCRRRRSLEEGGVAPIRPWPNTEGVTVRGGVSRHVYSTRPLELLTFCPFQGMKVSFVTRVHNAVSNYSPESGLNFFFLFFFLDIEVRTKPSRIKVTICYRGWEAWRIPLKVSIVMMQLICKPFFFFYNRTSKSKKKKRNIILPIMKSGWKVLPLLLRGILVGALTGNRELLWVAVCGAPLQSHNSNFAKGW